MDQGHGARSALPQLAVCVDAPRRRRYRHFWHVYLTGLLLLLASLCHAQNYVYDGNGRLTAATRSDGTSVRYVYDNLGNLQQVFSVAAGQLSLFSFAPNHGGPGLAVTLSGQGFSAAVANDSVSFNGIAATVTAATATSLVAVVPVGATTGSISVTVGTQTVTSTDPFVVDDTGLPPTITAFSPAITSPGTVITVAGQHLAPAPTQTRVALSGQILPPTSVTDTAITFAAPSAIGSGRITIETPFGLATSSTDLVVVPSAIGLANVVASGRITEGSTQALSMAASKSGVLLFDAGDAINGTWLTFQLNALTGVSSMGYSVYDPRNQLVVSGTVSSTAPSLHLPQLTVPGTYSIYFNNGSAAATLTVGLEADPQLTLSASSATPAVTVSPYQSKRYFFLASLGLMLNVPSVATTPQGDSVNLTVNDIYGTATLGPASGTATFILNMPFLQTGHWYQAVIAPQVSTAATINTAVQLVQAPGGSLTIDGPSLSTSVVAQANAFYSFTAAPGDNLELALSGVATSGSGNNAELFVYDPSGTLVTSNANCYPANPAGSCRVSLPNLAGGTYSITVKPYSTGTMSFQTTLTRDVASTLTLGQSQTVSLTRPGQSGRLSFSGTAGQTVAIAVTQPSTTPANQRVAMTVLRPDGTTWINATEFSANGALNLPNLPMTGTYAVLVQQDYGLPLSVQLMLAPMAGGTLVTDGPSQSVTTFNGQNGYFTFAAATGDNLELALSNVTPAASPCSGSAQVYDPLGNFVASNSWPSSAPGGGFVRHLWALTSGTYSEVFSNCAFTGTVTLTRDIPGTLVVGQPPLALSLSRPGQTARLSFSAALGQTFSVDLSNIVTTPTGQPVTAQILAPNGNPYASSDSSSGSVLNLPNLQTAGTYTVIVSPDYGLPATIQASLLPQAGGVLTVGGPAQSVSAVAGQNGYLTFTAAAGDNLELGLSSVATSASCGGVNPNVYNASGNFIGNASWYTSNPGGDARISLPNLAAGSYLLQLSSCSGHDAFSGTVTLTRDLTGTLVPGTPVAIQLPSGQEARMSFSGTAGQTMTLTVSNYTTTPASQQMYVTVIEPNGTQWSSTTLSGSTMTFQNLPATGTYTLILAPYYGVPASMTVSF